jgi:hypothetical protein
VNERDEIAPSVVFRHEDVMNLRRRCLVALRKAMDDRRSFAGTEWIEHEREAITEAANVWALAHGLPTVTVGQVEAIEHLAVGHVDYAEKLALYVAEMTYGIRTKA